MNDFQIRNATKNDVPIILGLLVELERPKPKNDEDITIFEKRIKLYLSDSDKQILVAQKNSEVIGLVSIVFLPRLNRIKSELYIPELIVRKEYRKQGVGKKLINSCVEIAKEKKFHRIRLESGNERKESHNFYTNLGFEQSALSFTKNLNY